MIVLRFFFRAALAVFLPLAIALAGAIFSRA